MAGVLEF